ncbi:MAG: phosphate acyltransferase PlsX [Chromatiales bacterium]|nr:phosphate acyltransferase PlsX [Gammaproteobacteria bacterium]MCP5352526.1 phosphate acyltransferase PlsX [Chromatiales bacterium]
MSDASTKAITIALDAMGGDHGTDSVVPAAVAALDRHPDLSIILVGDHDTLVACLANVHVAESDRLRIHHASQTVGMDEPPAQALRGKKDSSMRVAINLVKEGVAKAAVSAGNTGALMAISRFVLKMLPGIERPAIISAIPSTTGHTHMLDLGANVDCEAEHLLQFALMGSELARAVEGVENPRVGLLNIGEEDIKGNANVKEAAKLIAASPLNYIGYVEGNDVFAGGVDVVVCDGFVGNVALKSSEGVAKMISNGLREEFRRNWLTMIAGLIAYPVLKRMRTRFDPRRYNGASLLGLRGIVIKSHGGADALAFGNAIDIAVKEVHKSVPSRIEERISALLAKPDRTQAEPADQ